MHVPPRSGFWSWRELVSLQDNLSAAQWRPLEEGGLRKDKLHPPQPSWRGRRYTHGSWCSCPLAVSHYMDIVGCLWLFVRRNGPCPQLGLTSTLSWWEGKCLPYFISGKWQYLWQTFRKISTLPKVAARLLWPGCSMTLKNQETPPVPPAACPPNAVQPQRLGDTPMKDTSEQNSAGQWKVVCCWLSKEPSDFLFLIPTYWRWCWGW